MIIKPVTDYYFINNNKHHQSIKPHLLNSMAVGNQDYIKLFSFFLNVELSKILKKLNCEKQATGNISFKQYKKEDNTNLGKWESCLNFNYRNIYCVDTPNQIMQIDLSNRLNKDLISLNIKEGDLLTFPSTLAYKIPKDLTDNIKTIIFCDTSFEVYKD